MIFGLLSTSWLYLKLHDVPVNNVHTKRKLSAIQTWRKLCYILWPLTAILISRGFMHASMTAFLPTYMNQQTGNLWLAGMALTLFEVAGVAGVLTAGSMSDLIGRRKTLLVSLVGAPICLFVFTLIGGWLVDRFNSKRLLPSFLVPMGVGCIVLGYSDAPWVIFVFMFLLGCSYGFSSAIFGTIWPETYGIAHLGAIRSIAVAAMVFASALGPGLTGWGIDLEVTIDLQLWLMGGYCLLATGGMAIVSKSLLARDASLSTETPDLTH